MKLTSSGAGAVGGSGIGGSEETLERAVVEAVVDGATVELGDPDEVLEGNTGGIETVVGRSTPTQRDSTFALTQQESVELTVLEPQKRHNPWRLPWYPHSSGSLLVASMQLLLSELAGLEQRAKSERISGTALLPGVPHRSGLDTITCSLIAKSACVCQPYDTV